MRSILSSVLSFAAAYCIRRIFRNRKSSSAPLPDDIESKGKTEATVVYVVDGDTVIVRCEGVDDDIKVRLIGVDAPESVHRDSDKNTKEGKIASLWLNKRLIGKRVRLELGKEPVDRYGRWLAYVFVGKEMVNRELLAAGMAKTMRIEPNTKYAGDFAKIESKARKNKAGFWGKESNLFLHN